MLSAVVGEGTTPILVVTARRYRLSPPGCMLSFSSCCIQVKNPTQNRTGLDTTTQVQLQHVTRHTPLHPYSRVPDLALINSTAFGQSRFDAF